MTDNANPSSHGAVSRPRQRLTPQRLLEAKRLSDPQIHPDGQRIAFVVQEADFDDSRWVSHLWLAEWSLPEEAEEEDNPDPEETERELSSESGGQEGAETEEEEDLTRQLTYSHEGESDPRWSPDGRYLAFLSARPDPTESLEDDEDEEYKDQIWVLPIEGGEAWKVTQAKEGILDFAWTPDSEALIYLAPEPRPRPVESTRKERERRKVDPIVEHEDRLRRQFWRIGIEEKKPKLLFTGDYGVEEFVLSPDGERLCYATNYTGDWNDYHLVDLFVRNLADGATVKLTDRTGGKYHPRWSPDGTAIAFLSWLDPQLSYSRESLFLVDAPTFAETAQPPPDSGGTAPSAPDFRGSLGGGQAAHPASTMQGDNLSPRIGGQGGEPPLTWPAPCRLLTDKAFDYDISRFEWSYHDGNIYAVASVGTGSELYCIHTTTTRLELGKAAERSDLGVEPEGSGIAWIQESADTLPELFLRNAEGEIRQLTKLNADLLQNCRLPRQEVVSWKSADGTPIEGVLTYPLDYQEGTAYPLIVQVHGGPKGRATHTLRAYGMPPVWSAEGYAVLQPNFRGSEGYGNRFAIANRRDLGGGDFADIMAGVDWCIRQGIADPERLGIMGGSYGGYMTNWAIGHTDRFKGAVSMFGIFHLQTDYSNSELSRWENDYLGAYYWEDAEIFRRLSPGSYLQNIMTPTLILHGDEDNNTSLSNSRELYQALRHRGVTTQFVHYPREGHGLREPNHKLDEVRRCLAWMDRYVRQSGQKPAVYRVQDKVPHADGHLELCITRAEIVTLHGQPKPEMSPTEGPTTPTSAFLEVVLTIHNLDTRQPSNPLTLSLQDLRLEAAEGFHHPQQGGASRSPNSLITRISARDTEARREQGEEKETSRRNAEAEAIENQKSKIENSSHLITSSPHHPIGIAVEVPGGKILVEGENLRTVQHPDSETGVLAFGFASVFRVPMTGGEALLHVADFPPVAVTWTAHDEEEAEKKEAAE